MSILIVLALLFILAALAAAGFFMLRGGSNASADAPDLQARNKRMAMALAVRIGVSVVLFICILLAWKFGYLKPTGIALTK